MDFQVNAMSSGTKARDMQGIDQCLDRLGEVRGMARNLNEALRIMDTKLHGPRVQPPASSASLSQAQKAPSNTEEMHEKISDIHGLLHEMRDLILQINNFINAEIS